MYRRTILQALDAANLVLPEADGLLHLEMYCRENQWCRSAIWLAHATRLDDSPLMYFTPAIHEALQIVSGRDVPFVLAQPRNRRVALRIVGVAEQQPFHGFWDGECQFNLQRYRSLINDEMYQYFQLARAIEEDLAMYQGEEHWKTAFEGARVQLWMHRLFVHRLGVVLNVDVDGHDLTLSRAMIAARGWLSHWQGGPRGHKFSDVNLTSLCQGVISRSHSQREDHSPMFRGPLSVVRCFINLLALHLHHGPFDGNLGWGVPLADIPEGLVQDWLTYQGSMGYIDLYNETSDLRMRWAQLTGVPSAADVTSRAVLVPTGGNSLIRTNPLYFPVPSTSSSLWKSQSHRHPAPPAPLATSSPVGTGVPDHYIDMSLSEMFSDMGKDQAGCSATGQSSPSAVRTTGPPRQPRTPTRRPGPPKPPRDYPRTPRPSKSGATAGAGDPQGGISPARSTTPEVCKGSRCFQGASHWTRCINCGITNYFTSCPTTWQCHRCGHEVKSSQMVVRFFDC